VFAVDVAVVLAHRERGRDGQKRQLGVAEALHYEFLERGRVGH